ncbi:MAG: hypothetical protein K0Q95_695 [Bacteroidota bacterium]|jgi:hypothetical protein|nr:hypothetical protein [Bacteroidota bacterium]
MRVIIFFLFACLSVSALAQCSPDLSCLDSGATSGVCPTSGLDTGIVGTFFSQVVSVKVPEDGTDFGQPLATIISLDIVGVDSLAPGLTYNCSPANCSFPGNSTGCIRIFGTPTVPWDHKIVVHAEAHVRIFFVNSTQAQTISSFYSVVREVVGIEAKEGQTISLEQNSPNPFNANTVIKYYSSVNSNDLFEVFDLIGNKVYEENLGTNQGENLLVLKADYFKPGVYFYSLTIDGTRSIRKMVVAGN